MPRVEWATTGGRRTTLSHPRDAGVVRAAGIASYVVLMRPMETVACGASGRTVSPQLE